MRLADATRYWRCTRRRYDTFAAADITMRCYFRFSDYYAVHAHFRYAAAADY